MLVMVGMAMMASIKEAFNMLRPVGMLSHSCNRGARTTMPTKPRTTEGRLARSSTAGFTHSRTAGLATSARYKAAPRPRGTAMTEEIRVTDREPTIKGRMPKSGGS